jgi:hypothetical protein
VLTSFACAAKTRADVLVWMWDFCSGLSGEKITEQGEETYLDSIDVRKDHNNVATLSRLDG